MMGGSPGLVVMGGDSCSKGCGFESQHRILDGQFSHSFVVKIVMFVWKDKLKRGRGWPIKDKNIWYINHSLFSSFNSMSTLLTWLNYVDIF